MSVGDPQTVTTRIALFLLLFAVPHAALAGSSGGINLAWNDCGATGATQKSFACSGCGRMVLVASAIAGAAMPKLNGQTAVLEVQTSSGALPGWWQLSGSGCRAGSPSLITADFNFTSGGACADPWGGAAMGGLDYAIDGSGRARIRTICAIAGSTSISGNDEYGFFKVSISTARSETCGGCADGVCIAFDSILLSQPPGMGDRVITTAIDRNWVQWQGGSSPPGAGTGVCSAATAQTAKSWGGLKSLYR